MRSEARNPCSQANRRSQRSSSSATRSSSTAKKRSPSLVQPRSAPAIRTNIAPASLHSAEMIVARAVGPITSKYPHLAKIHPSAACRSDRSMIRSWRTTSHPIPSEPVSRLLGRGRDQKNADFGIGSICIVHLVVAARINGSEETVSIMRIEPDAGQKRVCANGHGNLSALACEFSQSHLNLQKIVSQVFI